MKIYELDPGDFGPSWLVACRPAALSPFSCAQEEDRKTNVYDIALRFADTIRRPIAVYEPRSEFRPRKFLATVFPGGGFSNREIKPPMTRFDVLDAYSHGRPAFTARNRRDAAAMAKRLNAVNARIKGPLGRERYYVQETTVDEDK